MGTAPPLTRSQQSYYQRLARRRHRFVKRLRFLLLGLKLIGVFAPPLEKLMIALIKECISQIWPEPSREATKVGPSSHRQNITAGVCARSGNAQAI
jgi:hypothetical protein